MTTYLAPDVVLRITNDFSTKASSNSRNGRTKDTKVVLQSTEQQCWTRVNGLWRHRIRHTVGGRTMQKRGRSVALVFTVSGEFEASSGI